MAFLYNSPKAQGTTRAFSFNHNSSLKVTVQSSWYILFSMLYPVWQINLQVSCIVHPISCIIRTYWGLQFNHYLSQDQDNTEPETFVQHNLSMNLMVRTFFSLDTCDLKVQNHQNSWRNRSTKHKRLHIGDPNITSLIKFRVRLNI